ncbi:oleate hydratase [Lactococcus sp.]|uniref:oleate hydratase n=1 Tax=Lactococcus sp. TaxID=44273 RepID=UPI0035B0D76E
MYHSNGNYEAFARPKKSNRSTEITGAYLIGSGLASLAAATFLIRDGQISGDKIHILEELPIPGGSLDGIYKKKYGYVIRGGREMEEHFECLWDLFRSIPSLEIEDASILDEFYWINKEDPNYSNCRIINNRGVQSETDGKLLLTKDSVKEILNLCLTSEDNLDDKKITDVFTDDFFASNFWTYWCTMFAFEKWHSALEMRRYLMRFIHQISALTDFSSLRFTAYNQYESLVLPLTTFLKNNGVQFQYDTVVKDVEFTNATMGSKIASSIEVLVNGNKESIDLSENDLLFVTNGSITESSTYGTNETPAPVSEDPGNSWKLWETLAEKDAAFGKPSKFYKDLPKESWYVSATITVLDDEIAKYIEKISKRSPYAGKVVTGGIVHAEDSNWKLSYTINRQPHFKDQPKDQFVVWFYALLSDTKGNHINKVVTECSGQEIAAEWLYHLGVPINDIDRLVKQSCNIVPCYMPYITSYFMPRAKGDRPLVRPKNYDNIAFIGNFAETERDTVFTTEYSVRTAMEAVYDLVNVDRGVPEVYASSYDIRALLKASYYLNDQKKITEVHVPLLEKFIAQHELKKIEGTFIEELLKESKLL